MDKNSSASQAESSSAGRGNPEDARSASGHKGKDDHKAPQSSSTSGLRPIQSILKEAMYEADVKEITVDMLDKQIEHISKQIDHIKLFQGKQKHAKPHARPSSLVRKINTSFSKRMTATNSVWKVWCQKCPQIGEIRTMAADLLGAVGSSQSCFAGLLIVAHVLRRFDAISGNRVECLELLKDINVLAKMVIGLSEQVTLSLNTEAGAIQEARQLILEGSILCCTILEESKDSILSKLFKASGNKDQLTLLGREVDRIYKQLMAELSIENFKAIQSLQPPDSKHVRRRREMQDFSPDHAVGIEEEVKKVIADLELESEKKTVAVIVHGLPGMGKTTLADSAYSKILQENYNCSKKNFKYSKIRLCEHTDSPSDIKSLQTFIREELVGDDDDRKVAVIKTFEEGRQQIGDILRRESAFLYIDNVLSMERLEQLLPSLDKAKKLRLLITARDKGIRPALGHNISCKFHQVRYSTHSQAEKILKQYMDTQKLDKGLVDEIIQTSGGVPLYLRVIGQFIGAEEDTKKAWRIFREERESLSGQIFDRLDIVWKYLPDGLKDPFLDICSFFHNEWYWKAVEDIVGTSELDSLEKRGLFTKDGPLSTVTVHDVILRIGLQKSKGSRIMHPNEISQLDRKVIKGFWSKKDQGLEPISAIKLDQIASSLRILALQNLKVEGDYNENFPELIYLDAGMNPLPSNVSAFEKLSYLSYSPQKPEDLNLSQMPSKMKRLKLNGNSYSRLFRSCSLDLHGLQNLRVLKLYEFKHLTKLPKEFAFLKCLEVLHIIDCDGFEELPTDLGNLNLMSNLTIENCPKLRKLPESILNLTSLQSLKLPHCARLRQLPKDFGSLSSLRTLDLKGTGLKMLPTSFAQLSKLNWLCLSSCNKLEDLSKDFHSLPSLRYLTLSSCPMLQGQWMDVIKKVKTIKEVDIRKSEKLLQKWQGITDPPRTFSVKVN